ncbi:hypothetical protein EVAR_44351_1 [Eumeta japonica]|uniref:Uncharacterized protein n=1 Tax=Eumeta variegata TaxID=151549 RepID=A0A4C1X5S9_EUMVA|nr:hypothetical protein EVAR_44351_1 [Eumeta japonica]
MNTTGTLLQDESISAGRAFHALMGRYTNVKITPSEPTPAAGVPCSGLALSDTCHRGECRPCTFCPDDLLGPKWGRKCACTPKREHKIRPRHFKSHLLININAPSMASGVNVNEFDLSCYF